MMKYLSFAFVLFIGVLFAQPNILEVTIKDKVVILPREKENLQLVIICSDNSTWQANGHNLLTAVYWQAGDKLLIEQLDDTAPYTVTNQTRPNHSIELTPHELCHTIQDK